MKKIICIVAASLIFSGCKANITTNQFAAQPTTGIIQSNEAATMETNSPKETTAESDNIVSMDFPEQQTMAPWDGGDRSYVVNYETPYDFLRNVLTDTEYFVMTDTNELIAVDDLDGYYNSEEFNYGGAKAFAFENIDGGSYKEVLLKLADGKDTVMAFSYSENEVYGSVYIDSTDNMQWYELTKDNADKIIQ